MDVKRAKAAEKNFPVLLRDSVEKMRSSGKAETVFGPPRKENGRTLIPVARVAFGFGGGYGSTTAQKGRPRPKQRGRKASANGDSGLGGGGGMRIIPAGMFEISDGGTRFLPVRGSLATTALTLAGGVLVGMLLSRGDRKGGKGGKGKKSTRQGAPAEAAMTDLR
ncbi:MAG: hypothetical protein M3116_01805 [Actinomycetota bacterium]|nr:hypothetical protein [Actinomycetota bacterium]